MQKIVYVVLYGNYDDVDVEVFKDKISAHKLADKYVAKRYEGEPGWWANVLEKKVNR